MSVFVNLPIEPGEEGRKTAAAILDTVATFCEKARFEEDDVVKVTVFLENYDNPKIYYDISYQIRGEENEEPDYEIVRVKFYRAGGWEIEPISFNPPKVPFWGCLEPKHDMSRDWQNQVGFLLGALQFLYASMAEFLQKDANDSGAQATKMRQRSKALKSKVAKTCEI